jgi:hypothetical protein
MLVPESDIGFYPLTLSPRTNDGQSHYDRLAGSMGYSKKRIDRNGKARYTACYLDARGSLRSAGTFTNKKDSDKAWQKSETRVGEGRLNDPRRGLQSFRRYVTSG